MGGARTTSATYGMWLAHRPAARPALRTEEWSPVIPEDNRFESDPTDALPEDPGLPAGWSADSPDGDDPATVERLTELLRGHERAGRGWAGSGEEETMKPKAADLAPVGSFEEQVMLAVLRTRDEAYGMAVRREIERVTERELSIGAVYATLERLSGNAKVGARRHRNSLAAVSATSAMKPRMAASSA